MIVFSELGNLVIAVVNFIYKESKYRSKKYVICSFLFYTFFVVQFG
jgi:hypothetical protein